MTDGAPAGPAVAEFAAVWLAAQQQLVAAAAAHEIKNSLNGVSVNLAVVQSRLRRQQAPESVTRFADAATSQLELLTVQVEALLALVRPPDRTSSQSDFLRSHGLDELVEEGRRRWEATGLSGGLDAVAGRSRVHEAEALTDDSGLGGFTVLEWVLTVRDET